LTERAEALITGLVLYVLGTNQTPFPSLRDVRRLVESSATDQFKLALDLQGLSRREPELLTAANILSLPGNRTRSSIMTTASSHMTFLRSGPVQKSTSRSTMRLADVMSGEPMTIYLVLPPDKLLSHGKLLRLWLGVLMATLSRRRRVPGVPTLLLIDEAAQLGPLDELRAAVTLMRGYGVRCWSFWQDLSQLQCFYPLDWKSPVNNCSVQTYFGVSAPQAARELEDYLGPLPVKPISQLKADEALLIRRGCAPEVVRRPDYRHDPSYARLAMPNPFSTRQAPMTNRSSMVCSARHGRSRSPTSSNCSSGDGHARRTARAVAAGIVRHAS
jgi:type IV secretion system protein VirD4